MGTIVDRWGADSGTFVSPQGTAVSARSLAPGTTQKPFHTYEVLQPIAVLSGSVASWFDEPGGGVQYRFSETVGQLVAAGKLREIV